jgi:hypothetical protein
LNDENSGSWWVAGNVAFAFVSTCSRKFAISLGRGMNWRVCSVRHVMSMWEWDAMLPDGELEK